MFRIGCHISAAGGYLAMGKKAAALGANTFAFFTRNPRGGASKALDEADVTAFLVYAAERDISSLVAHAPYTLNPCAEKENVREFARLAFREDLQRMEHTPGHCYNFHPGSHVGQGVAVGIKKITEILNESLFPEMHTTVLLETMAGKGSEVGGRFEELRSILDGVELSDKMGIPINFVDLERMKMFESKDIQKSEFVKSKFGIYGVCEPSALITAGFDSKLIYKKTSYNGVTIAVAISK